MNKRVDDPVDYLLVGVLTTTIAGKTTSSVWFCVFFRLTEMIIRMIRITKLGHKAVPLIYR